MNGSTRAPHEPDHEPWAEARVNWRDVACAWLIVFALCLLVALIG